MFNNKCSEARFNLKQTEPYYTRQNDVDETIIELKRGAGRNITKAGIPKIIWYYCLKLEGLFFSYCP